MAVAFDAVSTGTKVTAGAGESLPTLTISHTPISTTNGALFISASYFGGVSNVLNDDPIAISSVTYNGNACTHYANQAGGTNRQIEIWYYIGTIFGANNVVITWDDTLSPGSALLLTAVASVVSVTGAHQTTPIAQGGGATGSVSPITKSLTTASVNNMLLQAACLPKGASTVTISVSTGTSRANTTAGTNGATTTQGTSTMTATGGSDAMSWTESANRVWGTYVIEIQAPASSGVINFAEITSVPAIAFRNRVTVIGY